jgi:hypothetical protein
MTKSQPKSLEPCWKFETGDWCSSWYDIHTQDLTMDVLWPYIRSEGWNGKKHNYRLIRIDDSHMELQSNLYCGVHCDWRTCQVLSKLGKAT